MSDGGASAQITSVTGKLAGSVTSWVAGTALVVSVATGYYFIQNNDSQINNTPVANEIQVDKTNKTEISSQQPEANIQVESIIDKGVQPRAEKNNAINNSPERQSNITETHSAPLPVTTNAIHQNDVDPVEKASNNNTQPAVDQKQENNSTSNEVPAPVTTESALPKPTVTASSTSGYAPLNVTFSTNSSLPIIDWNFGDGSEPGKGVQTQHLFDKPGSYLVTMKATDENGKVVSGLTRITVLSDLTIADVPNIFTPNGDGSNDAFVISTDKDIDFEVNIYTQNGRFVHKFYGKEGSWNGKINNNQDAGEGTYFYIIFATGQNGESNTQKGTITLKR